MVHLREAFVSRLALITIPDRRFDRPMTAIYGLCLARQRGSLSAARFAVGFHFAFDYMQLFVIGTPNGAQFPVRDYLMCASWGLRG